MMLGSDGIHSWGIDDGLHKSLAKNLNDSGQIPTDLITGKFSPLWFQATDCRGNT